MEKNHIANKRRRSAKGLGRKCIRNICKVLLNPKTPLIFIGWLKVVVAIFKYFDDK